MEGIDEPFQYDNTYIVDAILDKKQYWAPFYKTGELTDAGIAFIEKIRPTFPTEKFKIGI